MCSRNVRDKLAFKPQPEEWSDFDRWRGENQALGIEGMTATKVWAGRNMMSLDRLLVPQEGRKTKAARAKLYQVIKF